MVVSSVIAQQLRWNHGTEYFAAGADDQMAKYCVRLYQDESLWQRLRDNSLTRVAAELSPAAFADGLRSVLNEVVAARGDTTPEPHR
jgi:hypothetical protein